MILYLLIAILNGFFVGTSRSINGQLSVVRGAFRASLWNHAVGFAFLSLILLATHDWSFAQAGPLPPTAYLGGLFGAVAVAVNSYVFPRIGAMNAVLLVISGQMISAVVIDYASRGVVPSAPRCAGVALVLAGVYLTRLSTALRARKDTSHDQPRGRSATA